MLPQGYIYACVVLEGLKEKSEKELFKKVYKTGWMGPR